MLKLLSLSFPLVASSMNSLAPGIHTSYDIYASFQTTP
ncbi:hypothetical protein LINPERPRIM_LOCUS27342 [Linum perenne]